MRPGGALASEAAADELGDDTDVLQVEAELLGEHVMGAGDVLGRVVHGELSSIRRPLGDRRVQLDRVVVHGGRAVDVIH